jgi:hypothetical protein
VDVERANATYGDGIVTVALPRTASRRARKIEIALDPTGTARGERVGHSGVPEAVGGGEAAAGGETSPRPDVVESQAAGTTEPEAPLQPERE